MKHLTPYDELFEKGFSRNVKETALTFKIRALTFYDKMSKEEFDESLLNNLIKDLEYIKKRM